MGVRGIGLEGVRMRSRKRSVFVYSYSGLLDAKLAMVDMHEFRLEKEKTITMYEIYIYMYVWMYAETNRSPSKKRGRDPAKSAAAFRQQLPVLCMRIKYHA